MTFLPGMPDYGAEPIPVAQYATPHGIMTYLATPYRQPGFIPPCPDPPPPDRTMDSAAGDTWFWAPRAQSSGEAGILDPYCNEWVEDDPESDSEPNMALAGTWFPPRMPDLVEWDDVRGGRLLWTPHPRTQTGLPPTRPATPAPALTPAPAPASAPAPAPAPAPAAAYPSQPHTPRRTPPHISTPLPPFAPAPAPRFQWTPAQPKAPALWATWTPAGPPAWLHATAPAVVSAPAQPPAWMQRPTISVYLTPTPRQHAAVLWDAAITPPEPGGQGAAALRLLTARANIIPIPIAVLAEPATSPPARALRVRLPDALARWGMLHVGDASKEDGFVSVGDLLRALYAHLHTLVTIQEWNALPASERDAVCRAMDKRCRRMGALYRYAWSQGVKRVDLMKGKTMFWGAWPVPILVQKEDGNGVKWMWEVEVTFEQAK